MQAIDPSVFSSDYLTARRKFREASEELGCARQIHCLPVHGSDGSELTMDVARFGREDASRLLVLLSGTHGIEGLCGSGCQVDWLRAEAGQLLPEDLAVVLIHFVNPWGGAKVCIENENNVDLNRNFLDHKKPHPENMLYEELHTALICSEFRGPLRDAAEAEIQNFIERLGFGAFLEAVARGQYGHPDGFNFGGTEPQWSNRVVRRVLAENAGQANRVALIDYHTGLGPYGNGMIIFDGAEISDAGRRAKKWYGPSVVFNNTADIGYLTTGGLAKGCDSEFVGKEYTGIVLEYGTWEIDRIANSMRDSFWLHRYGDPESELGRKIQDELRNAFYVDKADWKSLVLERSRRVIVQAVAGLLG